MKTLALAAFAVVMGAGAALADPLEGMWRTAQDDNGNSGLIQVAPCGSYLCSTLLHAYDMQGTLDEIGRVTFIDWSSGLWHPHTFTLQNRTALEAIQRMRTSGDSGCDLLLAHAMTVVVAWPGNFKDGRLLYAKVGHPEHCDVALDGAIVLELN